MSDKTGHEMNMAHSWDLFNDGIDKKQGSHADLVWMLCEKSVYRHVIVPLSILFWELVIYGKMKVESNEGKECQVWTNDEIGGCLNQKFWLKPSVTLRSIIKKWPHFFPPPWKWA